MISLGTCYRQIEILIVPVLAAAVAVMAAMAATAHLVAEILVGTIGIETHHLAE